VLGIGRDIEAVGLPDIALDIGRDIGAVGLRDIGLGIDQDIGAVGLQDIELRDIALPDIGLPDIGLEPGARSAPATPVPEDPSLVQKPGAARSEQARVRLGSADCKAAGRAGADRKQAAGAHNGAGQTRRSPVPYRVWDHSPWRNGLG
jgi:hypothetical protein